jgi:hypothetical protein
MEVKAIVQEIERLPLSKKFFVIEETLKSIKKEELNQGAEKNKLKGYDSFNVGKLDSNYYSANEKSLAKDWLSEEDNRWDKIL